MDKTRIHRGRITAENEITSRTGWFMRVDSLSLWLSRSIIQIGSKVERHSCTSADEEEERERERERERMEVMLYLEGLIG